MAEYWFALGGFGGCGSTEPITNAPVAAVVQVPDPLHEVESWYKLVDIDGDGHLSREEVVQALRALLPLDLSALDAATSSEEMWDAFDPDHSGTIELEELSCRGGLLSYIQSTFGRAGFWSSAALFSARMSVVTSTQTTMGTRRRRRDATMVAVSGEGRFIRETSK